MVRSGRARHRRRGEVLRGQALQRQAQREEITDDGLAQIVVALDDDENAGVLLRRARAVSRCSHRLRCRRDLGEAIGLLTDLLDEHLPVDAASAVERDVLHRRPAVTRWR